MSVLRKYFIILFVHIFVCTSSALNVYAEFVWRSVENNAFTVGEYLRYRVRWGLIPGGYATMEIESIESINGRKAYYIVSKARSNTFFDTFYKVRDIHKTWIDTESICSHRFSKSLREGNFRRKRLVEYDHIKGTMRIHKSTEIVEAEITPFIHDVLSSLYFTRIKPLEVGDEFSIQVNTTGKNTPVTVKAYKKETVTVPAGTYDCILIEPALTGEGIFKAKGRIWIWMTDDEKHIPVKMKSKIAVGSITTELISTEKKGTDNDF